MATLLQICAVRLLQDADTEIPEEMVIFSDHGDIGQACSDELRAAVKVRADLAKKTAQLSCSNIERKHQLRMLRDEATEQVNWHMISVVERLQSMKMSGTRVPSAEESERAAAVFVDKYYT